MNAASTAYQQTVAEQRSHEPSMEEILASIRRIIADDHALPLSRSAPPAPPPPRPHQPEQQPAQSSYDDFEAAPAFRAPPLNEPSRAPRPTFRAEPEPVQRPAQDQPVSAFEAPPSMHDDLVEQVGDALLSPGPDASVSSSFNALATTMMLQNSGMVEDSVREMLRPMLKTWLDDNLPGIVERLVRHEIERMARGRR